MSTLYLIARKEKEKTTFLRRDGAYSRDPNQLLFFKDLTVATKAAEEESKQLSIKAFVVSLLFNPTKVSA